MKQHKQWIKRVYRNHGEWLAKKLAHSQVQANHLTLSRLVFIMIAACLLVLDRYYFDLLAAMAIYLFSMLDAADGSLARMKKKSIMGAWLDPQIDRIGFLLLFTAIAIRLGNNAEMAFFWYLWPMMTLFLYFCRILMPDDINLKAKFSNLRSLPTTDDIGDTQFTEQQNLTPFQKWLSWFKLQTSPHTHNMALCVYLSLVFGLLEQAILLLGCYVIVWWASFNIKILLRAYKLDRQTG